jgi:2,3-bisphosphoglycerate-dependent phosphoglycerate mutase
MKKSAAILVLITFGFLSHAQVTTFILVRHAEKDLTQSTPDPDLSAEGKVRAEKLKVLLKDAKVSALYSTNYKRTKDTIRPLANSNGLDINTYEPLKKDAIDKMIADNAGGTIVVSGHSNTIPWTANYLLGKEEFATMTDTDYDNIYIITITADRAEAKAVHLRY